METPVAVIGHVDHGKSTLIGRILYDSKAIPTQRMEELQLFVEASRRRFEFAYFLDALQEEIEQERTIDTVRVCFQSQRTYRISDVPGHREFVGNMLTGAADAQLAVLVLAGPDGPQAQTLQHLFLCQMLGVSHLVVALNKMDLLDFQESLFLKHAQTARTTLARFGFHNADIIPVCATSGDNVCQPSPRMPWYSGPTLLQALDTLPIQQPEGPLRFAVQDTYHLQGRTICVGRVESGVLRINDTLHFPLSNATFAVDHILAFEQTPSEAHPGDCVGLAAPTPLIRGEVGGPPDAPPRLATTGVAHVFVLNGLLAVGDTIELGGPFSQLGASVLSIDQAVDATNGSPLPSPHSQLLPHQAARITFQCPPACLEPFSTVRSLGRFVVSKEATLVGFGILQ